MVVPLNRRYFEWNDKEPIDPEIHRAFGLEEGGVGWDELMLKRRVVILAEAGSGKSTEMAEQARLADASHRYAFRATVEDVGRDGLEVALSASGRSKLRCQVVCDWRSPVSRSFQTRLVASERTVKVELLRVVRDSASLPR